MPNTFVPLPLYPINTAGGEKPVAFVEFEFRREDLSLVHTVKSSKAAVTANDLGYYFDLRAPAGTHLLTGGTEQNPWSRASFHGVVPQPEHTTLRPRRIVRLVPRFDRPTETKERWTNNMEAARKLVAAIGIPARRVEYPFVKVDSASGAVTIGILQILGLEERGCRPNLTGDDVLRIADCAYTGRKGPGWVDAFSGDGDIPEGMESIAAAAARLADIRTRFEG